MNGDKVKQDMSDAARVKAEKEQIALAFSLADMFKPVVIDATTLTLPEPVISDQSHEESTQEQQPDSSPAINSPKEATDGKSAAKGGEESAVQAFARQHNTLPVGIRPEGLPEGRFKTQLMRLPQVVQDAVVAVLIEQKTPVIDLECMHIDENGQIVYSCFHPEIEPQQAQAVSIPEEFYEMEAAASGFTNSVPISSPPAFSSPAGATNYIFIDVNGAVISNTAWTTAWSTNTLHAKPLDTDGDTNTFSPAEQEMIKRIWSQVSEDYSGFNVNVTTVVPPNFPLNNRVAHALVTKSVDAFGTDMPYKGAGGVAYIGVFGRSDFAKKYSPAFVYYDSLGTNAGNISEATAHEIGHNMGLSHDGKVATTTSALTYYSGHGTGLTSWGTIMGAAYGKNVTQWSKGQYYGANNFEDDLSIISGKLGYAADDVSDSVRGILPSEFNGMFQQPGDTDTWELTTGGRLAVTVRPTNLKSGASGDTAGGNSDIKVTIYNMDMTPYRTFDNPADVLEAFDIALPAGKYILQLQPGTTGDPGVNPPTGYTTYGNMGGYTITADTYQVETFGDWAATVPAGKPSAPDEDCDDVGITNLERYAFGIEPGSGNQTANLPKGVVVPEGAGFAITYRSSGKQDVTISVQESSDMINWEDVNIPANTVATSQNADGTASVTVASTKSTPRVFMRVRVSML